MLKIETVTDLKWCDVEQTVIECQVKYAEFNEIHPTGVNAACQDPHIKEIWTKAIAGEYGVIAVHVPHVDPIPEPIAVAPESQQPVAEGTQTL
jgi:hypothetical protein